MVPVLPPDYSIKLIDDAAGIERLSSFNAEVHDKGVGAMTKMLAAHHPQAKLMRWLVVTEDTGGDIVSTVCLLPWTILYDGIELPAAEMGIVGTRKDHRRLGLVRALAARFDELVSNEGYLLSHIQGIPWFYRQFGYEYAVPLESKLELELRHITGDKPLERHPVESEPANGRIAGGLRVTLRKAGEDDVELLDHYYKESMLKLDLFAARTRKDWSYLLGPSLLTDYAADTYIVEAEGEAVGYCRVARKGFGEGLILAESSDLPAGCYPGLFLCLKETAESLGKPYIRVNLGPTNPAAAAARDSGAVDLGGYAWQIKVPEPASFLRKITPVLERRLASSRYRSFCGVAELNLYRESVSIHFESGKIAGITPEETVKGVTGYTKVDIPPNLFVPLVFGQKSFAECAPFYPDLRAEKRAISLMSVLFPPMDGFLHCPY